MGWGEIHSKVATHAGLGKRGTHVDRSLPRAFAAAFGAGERARDGAELERCPTPMLHRLVDAIEEGRTQSPVLHQELAFQGAILSRAFCLLVV